METMTPLHALAFATSQGTPAARVMLPQIESINLRASGLRADGAKALASALERGTFPRLRRIDLCGNGIGLADITDPSQFAIRRRSLCGKYRYIIRFLDQIKPYSVDRPLWDILCFSKPAYAKRAIGSRKMFTVTKRLFRQANKPNDLSGHHPQYFRNTFR